MPLLRALLAELTFLVTLGLIIARPRRIPEAASALGGGVLMLAIGAVAPDEAAGVLVGEWNVFLFFLGLMLVAALADQAGIFEWLATMAARLAGGSARRLLLAVFGLGTLLTAFLSNDATALILTPVVYALVTRLGLAARPYAYACTFIADTASFLLPVSNPINILILEAAPQPLTVYLQRVLVPAAAAIAINIGAFLWIFRAELTTRYDHKRLAPAGVRQTPSGYFWYTAVCLLVLACGYVVAAAIQFPLSIIALTGALALLVGAARYGQLDWRMLRREISWSLFGLVAGLFITVRGVENTGLTTALGRFIVTLAGVDPLRATLVSVIGTALIANLVSNVPAALILTAALGQAPNADPRQNLLYGTLIGADLGPNLTTVGSLATMLWLLLLRRRGLDISSLEYLRIGVLVTPPMLLAAAGALWLTGR